MKVINEIIDNIQFTPDCQNKWDFDGRILTISSRGYNRYEKSFYVGFNLVLKDDKNSGMQEWVEVLKDELFDENFEKLKIKVKNWYKKHFVEALEITIKILKGEYKIEKDSFSYKVVKSKEDKSLKALEIIKEKELNMQVFNQCEDVETYNKVYMKQKDRQLTQEEFNLLKEWLE